MITLLGLKPGYYGITKSISGLLILWLHASPGRHQPCMVLVMRNKCVFVFHYDDVITGAMVSQITSLTIVYSTVYSGADQSKHQRSASLAFVWEIHRWPVNSPHKWPVTRKMFPFDDVIMSKTRSSADHNCVKAFWVGLVGISVRVGQRMLNERCLPPTHSNCTSYV